jgi:ferrous iron transport protein B
LLTGLIAKELVVSTLSQVYSGTDDIETTEATTPSFGNQVVGIVVGFFQATADAARSLISIIPGVNLLDEEGDVEDTSLSRALQSRFSPLSAFAFLLFVLLYIPCMATIGAIKEEFGGRWATSAAIYQTAIAWLAAVLVFQGGRLLGLG